MLDLQQFQPRCLWGEMELVWVAAEGKVGAHKEGDLRRFFLYSIKGEKYCQQTSDSRKVRLQSFYLDTYFMLTTYTCYM